MAMKIALIPLRRSATIETIITDREGNDKKTDFSLLSMSQCNIQEPVKR